MSSSSPQIQCFVVELFLRVLSDGLCGFVSQSPGLGVLFVRQRAKNVSTFHFKIEILHLLTYSALPFVSTTLLNLLLSRSPVISPLPIHSHFSGFSTQSLMVTDTVNLSLNLKCFSSFDFHYRIFFPTSSFVVLPHISV